MNITGILIAAALIGGIGLFIGLFLGIAGIKFKVEVDEKEEAVLAVLPGNNCGGCGFAGCSGLAAAIAKGEAEVGTCPVGGEPVAKRIAEIMGGSYYAAFISIHECMIHRSGTISPRQIRRHLADVNNAFSPEENLSRKIFYYDAVRKVFSSLD